MIGDFNTVLSQADKVGGKLVASSSSGGLTGIITRYGLINIGFHGCPFTWINGRLGAANIQARLDLGLANDSWRLLFPKAHIFHLPAIQLDHKPLLLKLRRQSEFHPRPFRFEGMWTLEKSSIAVIKRVWHSTLPGSPLS